MVQQQKAEHTGGMAWYLIFAAVYIGLLIYFGWQTWQFVNWLFPGDALAMKCLAMLCFDILAFLWACCDTFYHFASRGTRTCIRWAWGISFALSLLASVLYLVISNMLRFNVPINQNVIDIGEATVIFALTLNILFLTAFLYREWNDRHPHQDGLIYSPASSAHIPQTQVYSPPQQEQTTGELEAWKVIALQLMQQQGGTGPLPLVQPPVQQHTSTGNMKKSSAKKAPQGANETMQP